MPITRKIARDTRAYDTTQLRRSGAGATLHRDYSAHFFRWSFVRRFVKPTDWLLDVGCGTEVPLEKILLHNVSPAVAGYVGVDLNPVKLRTAARCTVYSEFNFVERWREIHDRFGGFNVITCLEMIEHARIDLGKKLLKGLYECLKDSGTLLLSTPCYDGKRHAANHVHEWTVPELQKALETVGFQVERRFGTFVDLKEIERWGNDSELLVYEKLRKYFDNDALSNFFGPLYPDHARNNLWLCRKEA